jgi:hypothetical protein
MAITKYLPQFPHISSDCVQLKSPRATYGRIGSNEMHPTAPKLVSLNNYDIRTDRLSGCRTVRKGLTALLPVLSNFRHGM